MPDQVEPALVLLRPSPHPHQRAVGEGDLQAEHVVARHAILQAARSARVRRDVAAERTFLQARRVGRIKQTELARLRLEFPGDHARLHHAHAVDRIDLEHLVHPRERDDDPAPLRHASADVAAPRAPRRDGDFAPVGKAEQLRDILRLARENDRLGSALANQASPACAASVSASEATTPFGNSLASWRSQGGDMTGFSLPGLRRQGKSPLRVFPEGRRRACLPSGRLT
jgi:hypothetical protein